MRIENPKRINFKRVYETKGVKYVVDGNNHKHQITNEPYYCYSSFGLSVGVGYKGFEEFFMNKEDIEFTNEKR